MGGFVDGLVSEPGAAASGPAFRAGPSGLGRGSAGRLGGAAHLYPARLGRPYDRGHAGLDELAGAAIGRGDLDPTLLDRDTRSFGVGGNGEHGALDERHQIGRSHSEMRRCLLLDSEGGAAEILEHLDDSARLGGGRQPKPGPRRDDYIFLAPDQHGPALNAGGDDVARLKHCASDGGGGAVAVLHVHRSGRLGHPPGRSRGEGSVAPEEQKHDEGAQEHGRSPSAAAQRARAAPHKAQ